MSKKEEKAKEYSFNIPSEIYNTLETYTDKFLWKSEIERAFEAGWDAACDKACEWLEKNADAYIGVEGYAMLQDKFFEDFCKAMEE